MRKGILEVDFYKDIPLKCKLSKKPIPRAKISWTRCVCSDINCTRCMVTSPRCSIAGEKLQNTTDVEIKHREMSSTLTIKQQTSEKVMYRCMAGNEADCDECKWIILKKYSGTLFLIFKHSLYISVIVWSEYKSLIGIYHI